MIRGGLERAFLWRVVFWAAVLDWSMSRGFLNRFFYAHHWFPTNLTILFADKLTDLSSPAAVLLISASAPLFWTLLVLTGAVICRRLRRAKAEGLRPGGLLLVLLAVALFLLAEFILPWRGEIDGSHPLQGLFPIIHSRQGRAYELVYIYALPLVLLLRRWDARS